MDDLVLYRKQNDKTVKTNNLSEIFDNWKGNNEHWLFISPHDDDIIIGSGLLLQKAVKDNIKITVLITTDGSMGYCEESHRNSIIGLRNKETLESFKIVGISDVFWLNFPDSQLTMFTGKRKAFKDDPCVIEGFTGLQNAYTHYLRKLKPTRVFLPSGADLHVDHKITYQETLISLFHSNSMIWPELGSSLKDIPKVYEMAVYCDFIEKPDIKITGNDVHLNKKLEAILAYHSQEKIIKSLVNKIETGGTVEYFRDVKFSLYSPDNYKNLFKD